MDYGTTKYRKSEIMETEVYAGGDSIRVWCRKRIEYEVGQWHGIGLSDDRENVVAKMKARTKREMVRDIADLWPEMIKCGDWRKCR